MGTKKNMAGISDIVNTTHKDKIQNAALRCLELAWSGAVNPKVSDEEAEEEILAEVMAVRYPDEGQGKNVLFPPTNVDGSVDGEYQSGHLSPNWKLGPILTNCLQSSTMRTQ